MATQELAPAPGRMRELSGTALPVVITAIIILGSWQTVVTVFDVPSFIVPSPVSVVEALGDDFSTIVASSKVTLEAVLLGLVVGSALAIVVALAISRLPVVSGPVLTAAVILNCAPIVALAPIFNNWFGVTSIQSKAGVAGVMVFFPVLVNTTRGLLQVQPLHLELMSSVAASPRQVMMMLRLPNALPFLFNGLKLGTTLSVIGVIVTEYFGGPSEALGVYIAYQAALPRFAYAWAGILVASLFGLALFGLVSWLERLVMPWQAHQESDGLG